jgi:hypothetical protein
LCFRELEAVGDGIGVRIDSQHQSRSVTGARATDPVVPERAQRIGRCARADASRA